MATHAWHDIVHDMRDEMHDIATINHTEPARQAYLMLWVTFSIAPILFGLDKFAEVLTDNWEAYLATWVNDIVPGTASDAMLWVGAIEIAAGVLVFLMPRVGAYVVAAWLAAIIVNLISTEEFYDIALRDAGLLMGALALARLATMYHHREGITSH
jgi:hypothetical protein